LSDSNIRRGGRGCSWKDDVSLEEETARLFCLASPSLKISWKEFIPAPGYSLFFVFGLNQTGSHHSLFESFEFPTIGLNFQIIFIS